MAKRIEDAKKAASGTGPLWDHVVGLVDTQGAAHSDPPPPRPVFVCVRVRACVCVCNAREMLGHAMWAAGGFHFAGGVAAGWVERLEWDGLLGRSHQGEGVEIGWSAG